MTDRPDSPSAVADFAVLEAMFSLNIRVAVNWRQGRRENWPVRVQATTSRDELAPINLPWLDPRADSDTTPPLRAGDIRNAFSLLHEPRRAAMLEYALSFERSAQPPTFTVPVYDVGDHGLLLLDGCHCAGAAMLTGREFRIAALVLEGSVSAEGCWSLIRLLESDSGAPPAKDTRPSSE